MKNTTDLFLDSLKVEDVVLHNTKNLYEHYCKWCEENDCYKFTLTGFTRSIKKKFGLIVIRRRINGKLISFYDRA